MAFGSKIFRYFLAISYGAYYTTFMSPATFGTVLKSATELAFIGVSIFFVVMTFVLDYHWRTYSTSFVKLQLMRLIYLAVSGLLFAGIVLLMLSTQ